MGSTRGQIKTNIRVNLDDNAVTFYTDTDLNDSIQDAYDDICSLSQCIVKNTTLTWIANLSYINFITDYSITDYLATTAIFNNLTNRWLRDDLNLRDLDRLRRDWENWTGTPQFWAPSDVNHIVIAPKYTTSSGTFKLVYWASAPTLTSDNDTLLTASDVQDMFEHYCTADLLEQAQEYTKANEYWTKYYESLAEYSERTKKMNKSDLLFRV